MLARSNVCAVRALLLANSYLATVCDPQWGRDDLLWPSIVATLARDPRGCVGGLSPRTLGPTDTHTATHPADLAEMALPTGCSAKRMKGFEPSTFAMARRKGHADARR
jgi:hypothetical protein